jgi:hypothetical protein
MSLKKVNCRIEHYGIYRGWDRKARHLPTLVRFARTIPAQLDIEFGYVLHICGGRGKKIDYCIEHPPFTSSNGTIAPPFCGSLFITSNSYDFFLGDSLWEPLHDKTGTWRLITRIDTAIVADESFEISMQQ